MLLALTIESLAGRKWHIPLRSLTLMDYIEKAIDKLREWIDRVLDALFGSEPQQEPELIPIPVDEPRR